MAVPSTAQRKLFMHSAHQTIGVSGGGIALRPYCRTEGLSTDDGPPFAPLRVALIAHPWDADARAALASFERAVQNCRNVQCFLEERADADCVVLFRQGLHIARRLADLDTSAWDAKDRCDRSSEPIRIEIAAAARWHPLLEGMAPFESRRSIVPNVPVPNDATVLLVGRTANGDRPAAWLENRFHGRIFHTILGDAEDFRQPDFLCLLQNVLAWIGQ